MSETPSQHDQDAPEERSRFASRKFTLTLISGAVLVLSALLAAAWPAFASQNRELGAMLLALTFTYMGGNIGAKWVGNKPPPAQIVK